MDFTRKDFPMLNSDIIYFDNGATTFKPDSVIQAISDYYSNYCANAHRGDYDISYKVDLEYEGARDAVKEFINAASRDEIIFTSGATEGLNMLADGFFKNILEINDEIIISDSEHASNVLPWFRLAKTNGCIIKKIPLDKDYKVTIDALKSVITPQTKVISLAQVTNVIGDIRPIKEICEFAHQLGIFVVVDGSQSVPHMKVNVQDLDCDFLVFSGHKMCGPTGIGILYGQKELLEEMIPINLGGGMNESFDTIDSVMLKSLPHRLEAGTPNIAGAIGLKKAIEYLNNLKMDNIHKYEQNLRKYMIDRLIKIPHIDIINLNSESGIITINVDGIFSQDVAYYLNKYNICVRAGNHCAKILKQSIGVKNTLRISLYFYNTYEEIDNFIELISDKEKILKEMI